MDYTPSIRTIIFMSLFLVGYMLVLIRNAAKNRMDLFDSAMLALAAVMPSIVVFFPGPVVEVTRFIGVEFPLVVLFGALFVVVFAYLHILVLRLNRQQRTIVSLVQEAGLMREALSREGGEETAGQAPPGS